MLRFMQIQRSLPQPAYWCVLSFCGILIKFTLSNYCAFMFQCFSSTLIISFKKACSALMWSLKKLVKVFKLMGLSMGVSLMLTRLAVLKTVSFLKCYFHTV